MAREWTDEEVQKEIRDAVAIVREDRFEAFVRSTHTSNSDKDNPAIPSANPGNNDPAPSATKKKSLWWGEATE